MGDSWQLLNGSAQPTFAGWLSPLGPVLSLLQAVPGPLGPRQQLVVRKVVQVICILPWRSDTLSPAPRDFLPTPLWSCLGPALSA